MGDVVKRWFGGRRQAKGLAKVGCAYGKQNNPRDQSPGAACHSRRRRGEASRGLKTGGTRSSGRVLDLVIPAGSPTHRGRPLGLSCQPSFQQVSVDASIAKRRSLADGPGIARVLDN